MFERPGSRIADEEEAEAEEEKKPNQ